MRYVIIGASGQVGSEFVKCLPRDRTVALTHTQVDVTDPRSLDRALEGITDSTIVNLAAFHRVDACEDDAQTAFAVNAIGAANVARVAVQHRCRLVFFSTDYVFGLEAGRSTAYLEHDKTGPLNVYGASKIAGENLVRAALDEHLIVRTSSLFGATESRKGWTFPEMILRRARACERLRVVGDQFMSPTYTLDLARAVIALIDAGATGTVHVTNEGGCTWNELARETLKAAGVTHEVEEVTSDEFPSSARRPTFSQLDSAQRAQWGIGPLRHWKEALRAYVHEKALAG